LILLLAGAVLIAAGWAFRYFWLVLPMGDGPAGPPVAHEPFQQTWTTRKVLLLGIGDSVTAGWGVDQAHSYFGRLKKNPSDEFPDMQGVCLDAVLPNLHAENLAVSGSTSLDHITTDGLGTPGLTGLPPWPDVMKIHRAYNEVIHRCAQARNSVHLVPIHAAFLGHGIHCRQFWREHYRADDPHYWFATNLEDPNLRGYDAIRRVFLNEIVKIAGELKQTAKP
jgi:hypothetical protein